MLKNVSQTSALHSLERKTMNDDIISSKELRPRKMAKKTKKNVWWKLAKKNRAEYLRDVKPFGTHQEHKLNPWGCEISAPSSVSYRMEREKSASSQLRLLLVSCRSSLTLQLSYFHSCTAHSSSLSFPWQQMLTWTDRRMLYCETSFSLLPRHITLYR